jgi:hypothetical protein
VTCEQMCGEGIEVGGIAKGYDSHAD